MSRISRRTLTFLPFILLAACGAPESKFKRYDGPPVTQIVVNKGERRMYLMSGGTVLKAYDIGLGNKPVGTKQFEGDGKTPEGVYFIDRFNPDSAYHLSLGVSYPNIRDTAHARSQGRDPGGDIFIHGWGPEGRRLAPGNRDWTAGCIAVRDEIEEIYSMVGAAFRSSSMAEARLLSVQAQRRPAHLRTGFSGSRRGGGRSGHRAARPAISSRNCSRRCRSASPFPCTSGWCLKLAQEMGLDARSRLWRRAQGRAAGGERKLLGD